MAGTRSPGVKEGMRDPVKPMETFGRLPADAENWGMSGMAAPAVLPLVETLRDWPRAVPGRSRVSAAEKNNFKRERSSVINMDDIISTGRRPGMSPSGKIQAGMGPTAGGP
jgi:hypothetical protein